MKLIWAKESRDGSSCNLKKNSSHEQQGLAKSSSNNLLSKVSFIQLHQDRIDFSQSLQEPAKYEANGDVSPLACTVCGRKEGLQLHDSAEFHTILKDCFGISKTNPGTKICEKCADLIRFTHKFKEMICAAFDKRPSEEIFRIEMDTEISESPAPKLKALQVRRLSIKTKKELPGSVGKKSIATCGNCKQKYPSMSADISDFICSRCKILRPKNSLLVPSWRMQQHLGVHAKSELKGRCRLRSSPKKPLNAQTIESVAKKRVFSQIKLQCKFCPKKFFNNRNLASHLKIVHGEYLTYVCETCGRDMKAREFLEKHMKTHEYTKTFECEVCGKIFKTDFAIQRHYLVHKM